MIIGWTIVGLAVGASLRCCGFGVKDLAKAAAVKSLIDKSRRTVTLRSEEGERVTVIVDEFVYDNGELAIDFSIMENDEKLVVLTDAEAKILAKADWIGHIVDSEVEMSSATWRACISPLLRAVKDRGVEIGKSPTRQARLG